MIKTVQQRIIAVLLVLVIIVALFGAYDRYNDKQRYNEFLEKRNAEKKASVEKVIQLYGSKLEMFSIDYSVWDDMVNFVYNKDTSWIDDNVTAFLPKFSADIFWIFDSSLTPVHSDNIYKSGSLKKFGLPLQSLKPLIKEKGFIHFYMYTDSGICDVRGSSIHMTKDIDMKSEPRGYLFIGVFWNNNVLSSLSLLADSRLELSKVNDQRTEVTDTKFYTLPGWDGAPISYLKMTFESKAGSQKVFELYGDENVYLVVFGCALLFSVFFLLSMWVNKPVKALSDSLKKRDPLLLKKLLNDKTEFGTLAHLVDDSFREQVKKDTLLKEIHHRVKNNLQVITSLMNMQSRIIKEPELLKSFNLTKDRVKSIALIHEKLYQTDDLARIDISEYIKSLVNHLMFSYAVNSKKIRVQIDSDPVFLDIDTALPCGLIINEIVSNSFKYAFPNEGTGDINISFKIQPGEYHLTVGDNGIGIPDEKTKGTLSSLGIRLIKNLAKQLNGKAEFLRNSGTVIIITFPQ